MKKVFKIPFVFFLLISSLFSNPIEKQIPSITPIDWLKANINNPNLVIVDLRLYEDYQKGHLKNAVNIPGLESLFDDNFFMPKLDILKETCKFTDGKHIFEGTFIDALQYIKTQYKKGVPKLEELKKEVV